MTRGAKPLEGSEVEVFDPVVTAGAKVFDAVCAGSLDVKSANIDGGGGSSDIADIPADPASPRTKSGALHDVSVSLRQVVRLAVCTQFIQRLARAIAGSVSPDPLGDPLKSYRAGLTVRRHVDRTAIHIEL